MEYQSAKEKFHQALGIVGSDWGISRTMAQFHVLLLIAAGPLREAVFEDGEIGGSRSDEFGMLRAALGCMEKQG